MNDASLPAEAAPPPPASPEASEESSSSGAPAAIYCRPDHAGLAYQEFMAVLHQALQPATYMEIGTLYGGTLQLAGCPSLAIDPQFHLTGNVVGKKPKCFLFQTSSDAFFRTEEPETYLGGPVDLAFLDGMHWYEFLLRDFINTERHCRPNSVVLLHDCLPTDAHVARREPNDTRLAHASPHAEWWAGDVWKTVAILRRYRPDLTIRAFDAAPTGLVAVTGLDPDSTLLSDEYFTLVEEFRDPDPRGGQLGDFMGSIEMLDTRAHVDRSTLSRLFWL